MLAPPLVPLQQGKCEYSKISWEMACNRLEESHAKWESSSEREEASSPRVMRQVRVLWFQAEIIAA